MKTTCPILCTLKTPESRFYQRERQLVLVLPRHLSSARVEPAHVGQRGADSLRERCETPAAIFLNHGQVKRVADGTHWSSTLITADDKKASHRDHVVAHALEAGEDYLRGA